MSVELRKAECPECGASETREPKSVLYTRDSGEDSPNAPANLMAAVCSECGHVMEVNAL